MMPLNLGWVGGNIVTTTYPATQRKVYVKLTQSGGRTAVMEVKQATWSVVKYTGGWCPFYQWGRKDPFWPKDSGLYGSQAAIYAQTWVKPDYVWTFRYSDWSYVVNGTDIGHKYTLHGGLSSEHQGDWQSVSKCYNLWNATNTSAGEKTAAAKKTIYDPCPAGYCVPVSGAFDFDNNGAFGGYDEGWYIYTTSSQNETLYFPGKQLMTYEGVIRSVDGSFYWTADPGYSSTTDPHETAYNYRLTSTMHDPDWYHARSYAGYIRPIKDTNR